MGLSSWAYAADFGALVEKSSLKKNLGSFVSQKHLILHDVTCLDAWCRTGVKVKMYSL
jgi:hypothetical protein